MKITIISKTAPAVWGANAILSTTADGFNIHIGSAEN
ncbi:MAG: hypothetical protein GQ528_10865, partial [Woeseiaceae bacterium]|nr:hypothetical protein [Woeseiaceae bacterium]